MGEGIFGVNILKSAYWEFNIDEGYISAFSRTNTKLIEEKAKDMYCISDPLGKYKLLDIDILSIGATYSFGLDLGYGDEIKIDNEIREEFVKHLPYKKVGKLRMGKGGVLESDTVFVFENQRVKIGNDTLDNCRIVNIPQVNHNFVGAALMKRFNFVLGYKDMEDHDDSDRFYLRKATKSIKYPYLSAFDFDIDILGKEVLVTSIMEKSSILNDNLKLGDKVISIDEGHFDLSSKDIRRKFQQYSEDKDSLNIKVERSGQLYDVVLHRQD